MNVDSDAPTDGSAWEDDSSSRRVNRGGSWDDFAMGCRSAYRYSGDPAGGYDGIGFRLLRAV